MQKVVVLAALVLNGLLAVTSRAAVDVRSAQILDLNSPRKFPKIDSREEWQKRADQMREHILVSCGLWPLPEKTPLNAKTSGRIDHDGYSVEKVYFESYPGFYVAGNLYKPRGIKGPFPAVLSPHGHWARGRLSDEKDGSVPARCINFAKQGYVVFAYDMVGYNDTFFAGQPHISAATTNINFYPRHREIEKNSTALLWNLSLMGLQTWDSIRALDYLESLPDVDKKRIGVTGASGGATQTLILGAIDKRISVQAPVCMVSSTMQGGCACENAPGLRVEYSNMEFAALPAPRPQILVAATGDWTKMTLTFEGPAIEKIYQLFDGEEKLRFVIGNYNHNYNQASREQVYGWFSEHLRPKFGKTKEVAYAKDSDEDLRVFPDGKLPANALSLDAFVKSRIDASARQFQNLRPKNAAALAAYKKTFIPAWRETFQLEYPETNLQTAFGSPESVEGFLSMRLFLSGTSRGERVPAILLTPSSGHRNVFVVLAHPDGKNAFWKTNQPVGLAKRLLNNGASVLLLDTFLTGELADAKAEEARNQARKKQTDLFFTCYNRTDIQERVQDLITACTFARNMGEKPRVVLCGLGEAGLWAALAAPAADAVISDCTQLDTSSEKEWFKPGLFVPGLSKIGGIEGVAALAAPHPILLHNTGEKFSHEILSASYSGAKASKNLSVVPQRLSEEEIAQWVSSRIELGKIKED